jgi:hypothetical protein
LIAATAGALCLSVVDLAAQEPVIVVNFPTTQQVEGSVAVEVDEPIPHSRMVAFDPVDVTTVGRDETTRLIPGGTLETEGFTSVVLSMAGEIKGTVPEPSTLGVILLPDDDLVEEALALGFLVLPMELETQVPQESHPYASAMPERFDVAFPRYRVYFYNTGQRTVETRLFAMLSN